MKKFDLVSFNGKTILLGEKVAGRDGGYKGLSLAPSEIGMKKMRYTHTFISIRDLDKCKFVRRTSKIEREQMFLPEMYC